MKIQIQITIAVLAVGSGCASNRVARNAALEIQATMVRHEQSLDAKIQEQQDFYAARQAALNQAQMDNDDQQLQLSRRVLAMQYASRLRMNPSSEADIGPLADHLSKAVDADYALYKQKRAAEVEARVAYDASLTQIVRQKQALASARDSIARLTTKPSRKEQLQAALDFATELKKKIDEQNAKDAAASKPAQ